jgi:acyl-CoA synthetase (AMP-forming)/AMP-acid ligase II
MHPLIEAFAAHATRAPEREALSDEAGRRWTYGRLQSRVSAVARELVRNGVSPGGRVAVIGGRTADTVTALLGARSGAAEGTPGRGARRLGA